MEKHKLKESLDYVSIINLEASELNSDLFYRFYLKKPIRTLVGCRWLDSIVLKEGHYVWFKKIDKFKDLGKGVEMIWIIRSIVLREGIIFGLKKVKYYIK